jgi:hypothetical protein
MTNAVHALRRTVTVVHDTTPGTTKCGLLVIAKAFVVESSQENKSVIAKGGLGVLFTVADILEQRYYISQLFDFQFSFLVFDRIRVTVRRISDVLRYDLPGREATSLMKLVFPLAR